MYVSAHETKTSEKKKNYFMVIYLRATIIISVVVHQVSVVFHMCGIIQLTFMNTISIRIFNIKTDAGVIQVAKIFTLVQTLDNLGSIVWFIKRCLAKK